MGSFFMKLIFSGLVAMIPLVIAGFMSMVIFPEIKGKNGQEEFKKSKVRGTLIAIIFLAAGCLSLYFFVAGMMVDTSN